MLHLGSTYIIVKDFEKSLHFYTTLLAMQPTAQAYDRWAQFDFGGKCIALYNNEFDNRKIKDNDNLVKHYNDEYLEYYNKRIIRYGNNMILNFWIEDLNSEFERLNSLGIGMVSNIMYINISSPYHFFTILDPDGNVIEITGAYRIENKQD